MLNVLLTSIELCALYTPLVLGSYITISLMKLPDLAIESAFSMGATTGALMLLFLNLNTFGYTGAFVCSIGGILGGMLVGFCMFYLTHIQKLSHLLASIFINSISYGAQLFLIGPYQSLSEKQINFALTPLVPNHPEFLFIFSCAFFASMIVFYLLKRQFGYAIAIYGFNENFFDHYGISNRFVYALGMCIGHGLAGLSGFLFIQTNGFINTQIGLGKALFCITIIIMGKALFSKTVNPFIVLPLTGLLLYFVVQLTLLQIHIPSGYFASVQTIVTIALLNILRKKFGTSFSLGI